MPPTVSIMTRRAPCTCPLAFGLEDLWKSRTYCLGTSGYGLRWPSTTYMAATLIPAATSRPNAVGVSPSSSKVESQLPNLEASKKLEWLLAASPVLLATLCTALVAFPRWSMPLSWDALDARNRPTASGPSPLLLRELSKVVGG